MQRNINDGKTFYRNRYSLIATVYSSIIFLKISPSTTGIG